jgi:hypothetical protein
MVRLIRLQSLCEAEARCETGLQPVVKETPPLNLVARLRQHTIGE